MLIGPAVSFVNPNFMLQESSTPSNVVTCTTQIQSLYPEVCNTVNEAIAQESENTPTSATNLGPLPLQQTDTSSGDSSEKGKHYFVGYHSLNMYNARLYIDEFTYICISIRR